MSRESLHNKEKKFFFNAHVFDEDGGSKSAEAIAFEQKLDAAKRASFAEGRQAGLKETADARDQMIARTLDKIGQTMQTLLKAEAAREKIYEQESIKLALEIFEKLFPEQYRKNHFEELKSSIAEILQKQSGQKNINIYVHPDCLESIKTHIQTLKPSETPAALQVEGDETLTQGACRLSWPDGGAVRDPAALAEEIKSLVNQVLAGKAATGHDGGKEMSDASKAGQDISGKMERSE